MRLRINENCRTFGAHFIRFNRGAVRVRDCPQIFGTHFGDRFARAGGAKGKVKGRPMETIPTEKTGTEKAATDFLKSRFLNESIKTSGDYELGTFLKEAPVPSQIVAFLLKSPTEVIAAMPTQMAGGSKPMRDYRKMKKLHAWFGEYRNLCAKLGL